MERSRSKERSPLLVERHFVSSRLTGELMASAYEQVVPIVRRSIAPVEDSMGQEVDLRHPTQRTHPVAGGQP